MTANPTNNTSNSNHRATNGAEHKNPGLGARGLFSDLLRKIENIHLKDEAREIVRSLTLITNALTSAFPEVAEELRRSEKVENQIFEKEGIPLIKRNVPIDVFVLQDCGGAETRVRADSHYGDLGPLGSHGIKFYDTPVLSPDSIGATLASLLGDIADESIKGQKPAFINSQNGSKRLARDNPLIIVGNSAPRQDKPGKEGPPFVFARLGENIFYFGTNSRELGYVKNQIQGDVLALNIKEEHTYRSKRLGHRVTAFRNYDTSIFGDVVPPSFIVEPPSNAVRIADNFGNLKTGFKAKDRIIQDIPAGESVFVKINGRIGVARTASKLQDGLDGKLLLAMGSSIHDLNDLSNHQMDLYVKGVATGDNATLRFFPQFTNISPHDLAPVAGTKIEIAQINGTLGKLVAKFVEFSKVLPAWVVEPFVGGWRTE